MLELGTAVWIFSRVTAWAMAGAPASAPAVPATAAPRACRRLGFWDGFIDVSCLVTH